MSSRLTISFAAVVAIVASQATAQIPGDAYRVAPGLGSTAGFAITAAGLVDSTIDNAAETVGNVFIAPNDPIISTDTLVDNGGGNFTLTLRIESIASLAPPGFTVGGATADRAGLFIGANAGGADPVNFTNAALVSNATIAVLDLTGAVLGGPFNITTFANFANPAFGGGWDGSLGISFGAGSAGANVGGYELVVDYTVGVLLGTFTNSGVGCPPALPVSLSADSAPTIGASLTITASDLPVGSLASLLLGVPPAAPLPLDILGGTGCTLYVNGIFASANLMIAGTDGSITIPIANDPATIGVSLDCQAAAIAIGVNPLGVVTSDLGTILIGG